MKTRQEKIDEYNELIDIAHQNWLNSRGNPAFMAEMERLQRELTKLYNSDYGLKSNDEFVDKGGDKKKSSSSSSSKPVVKNITIKTEVIEETPNIDLTKLPKDILINTHSQIMNKGLPPNKMYVAKNISSATKDKIIEFIKKQKYSMNEFMKIADELYNNKKAENKKGLIKRKQTAKEIKEMEEENRNKIVVDRFIEDKQKELDERMKIKPVKPKKTYKEMNIMKARSDLKKGNKGKMAVETQMNISNKVDKKIIRALKKSILDEFDKKIEGLGLKLSKVKPSNESQEVEIVNSPSVNRSGLSMPNDNMLDRILHKKHRTKNMPNVDINPLIRNNYK